MPMSFTRATVSSGCRGYAATAPDRTPQRAGRAGPSSVRASVTPCRRCPDHPGAAAGIIQAGGAAEEAEQVGVKSTAARPRAVRPAGLGLGAVMLLTLLT